MDQLRRAAEWRRQEQQSAQALITDADIIALFEPREPREAWPCVGSDDRSAVTELDTPQAVAAPKRAAVPGFVSPALMLLATVSILQGYTLLNVLPDGGWQTSALLFAAVGVPLSVVLTRRSWRGTHTVTEKSVSLAAALVAVMTALALIVGRPSSTHLLGVSDLMFALLALVAVMAYELPARHTGPR